MTRIVTSNPWPWRIGVFVVVMGFFSIPIHQFIYPQLALRKQGAHAVGRITALEPSNHQGIKYEFQVGHNAYTGEWGPWPLSSARVGDPVPVTYLPDDPTTSVPGEPDLEGWWFLPYVLFPIVAASAALFGVRRRNAVVPPNNSLERSRER